MLVLNGVFASYDTWVTDTDVDADIEPPLEPEGPWQVCVVIAIYKNLAQCTTTTTTTTTSV